MALFTSVLRDFHERRRSSHRDGRAWAVRAKVTGCPDSVVNLVPPLGPGRRAARPRCPTPVLPAYGGRLPASRNREVRTFHATRFLPRCRRYRTIQIRAGQHILTAEDPLPPDLRGALALIK